VIPYNTSVEDIRIDVLEDIAGFRPPTHNNVVIGESRLCRKCRCRERRRTRCCSMSRHVARPLRADEATPNYDKRSPAAHAQARCAMFYARLLEMLGTALLYVLCQVRAVCLPPRPQSRSLCYRETDAPPYAFSSTRPAVKAEEGIAGDFCSQQEMPRWRRRTGERYALARDPEF